MSEGVEVRQKYKQSRYTVLIPLSGELFVLHSTLYKSTAVITKAVAELLNQHQDISRATVDAEAWGEIEKLAQQGLLVPSDCDETYYVKYLIDSAKFDYGAMEIAILTTMACNFACRYCTESGFHEDVWLNESTVERVVEYFERIFAVKHPRKFRIAYYGGEPLLNINAIKLCSEKFTELTARFNCELEQYVITNGYLLDGHMVESLSEFGIRDYQITLDGPEAIHDQRRPLHSGQPTWQRIMGNAIELLQSDKFGSLSIRINIDAHNANTIPELLDILVSSGIAGSERVVVYPAPVVPSFNPKDNWNKYVLRGEEKANVFITLWQEMYKRDIPVLVFPDYYPCGLRVDWASVVYPTGTLYTCTGFLGNSSYAKGSVFGEETSYVHVKMLEEDISPSCLKCKWTPFCGGGCKYIATCLRLKRMCEKNFCEKAYPEFIKLKTLQKLERTKGQIPVPKCF
ncbi:MAG: radical SAM protein [Methanomassiliicoccales archaeon]|nr:radical SAM protein [Methanomassiliicoccales archaeon]